ncbi:MAG: HD domain-containing protein [Planctomycetaceae bacterium]|nr:HD domain-containing protein [Planctomycetaceae bacterium]MBQ2822455.1 HD domain-containing protein [Thermoguttaceae bacterium]
MVELTSRFQEVLAWICEIHAGQRRKMNHDPYVSHLLRVGGMVLEWAEDEDEALAALLHDAAEDCGGEAILEEIRLRYGEKTARLVEQCSDSLAADPEAKRPWRERKEEHIARAARAEAGARKIMICDKIDNMRSMLCQLEQDGEKVFSHFKGGREILWYFRAMKEVLSPGIPEPLAREMGQYVEMLEKY